MASSKETAIVKKIQVDDRELKQFYKDFNNKNIIVKVSLDKNFQRSMESDLSSSISREMEGGSLKGSKKLELQMKDTSQKVKRDLSNSLLRGIEESSCKGSVDFSQNMKKEIASLNSTLDGFSKNLTSSMNKPMAIMSSFVSALGKNL